MRLIPLLLIPVVWADHETREHDPDEIEAAVRRFEDAIWNDLDSCVWHFKAPELKQIIKKNKPLKASRIILPTIAVTASYQAEMTDAKSRSYVVDVLCDTVSARRRFQRHQTSNITKHFDQFTISRAPAPRDWYTRMPYLGIQMSRPTSTEDVQTLLFDPHEELRKLYLTLPAATRVRSILRPWGVEFKQTKEEGDAIFRICFKTRPRIRIQKNCWTFKQNHEEFLIKPDLTFLKALVSLRIAKASPKGLRVYASLPTSQTDIVFNPVVQFTGSRPF